MTGVMLREQLELVPIVAMGPWIFSDRCSPDGIGTAFEHPER